MRVFIFLLTAACAKTAMPPAESVQNQEKETIPFSLTLVEYPEPNRFGVLVQWNSSLRNLVLSRESEKEILTRVLEEKDSFTDTGVRAGKKYRYALSLPTNQLRAEKEISVPEDRVFKNGIFRVGKIDANRLFLENATLIADEKLNVDVKSLFSNGGRIRGLSYDPSKGRDGAPVFLKSLHATGELTIDISGDEGISGRPGTKGLEGSRGQKGRASVCRQIGGYSQCAIPPSSGTPGGQGGTGGLGGIGGKGGNSSTLFLQVRHPLAFDVNVEGREGTGGKGGPGGVGGAGGKGGDPGEYSRPCLCNPPTPNVGPEGPNGMMGPSGPDGPPGLRLPVCLRLGTGIQGDCTSDSPIPSF